MPMRGDIMDLSSINYDENSKNNVYNINNALKESELRFYELWAEKHGDTPAEFHVKDYFLAASIGKTNIITSTNDARENIEKCTTMDYARFLVLNQAAESLNRAKTGSVDVLNSVGSVAINPAFPNRFETIEETLLNYYGCIEEFKTHYVSGLISAQFIDYCNKNNYKNILDAFDSMNNVYSANLLDNPDFTNELDEVSAMVFQAGTTLNTSLKEKSK